MTHAETQFDEAIELMGCVAGFVCTLGELAAVIRPLTIDPGFADLNAEQRSLIGEVSLSLAEITRGDLDESAFRQELRDMLGWSDPVIESAPENAFDCSSTTA